MSDQPMTLADLGFTYNPNSSRYERRNSAGAVVAFVAAELVNAMTEGQVALNVYRMEYARLRHLLGGVR